MNNNIFAPICMSEEYWANSQFSIVRYYGHIQISGHEYVIVNKEGKDIFECSIEADRAGRAKAIEPGEPCDLCRRDFVSYYRRLGREKFIGVLEKHPRATDKELKKIFKEL
jgi:hypothetical protein